MEELEELVLRAEGAERSRGNEAAVPACLNYVKLRWIGIASGSINAAQTLAAVGIWPL